MKWHPVPSATPPYVTIAEDTHFGVWQRDPERGFIDEKMMALILPHVPEGYVAIDGGAFNGEYSIAMARKAAKVFAFEPNPSLYQNLLLNVMLGEHKNIEPLNKALYRRRDDVMESPGWDGSPTNLGGLSMGGGEQVLTQSIDSYAGSVGFIKLDVEGMEWEVLRGAIVVMREDRPRMWIEMNRGALAEYDQTPEALCKWLDEVMQYDVTPGTGKIGDDQWDALCLPREWVVTQR